MEIKRSACSLFLSLSLAFSPQLYCDDTDILSQAGYDVKEHIDQKILVEKQLKEQYNSIADRQFAYMVQEQEYPSDDPSNIRLGYFMHKCNVSRYSDIDWESFSDFIKTYSELNDPEKNPSEILLDEISYHPLSERENDVLEEIGSLKKVYSSKIDGFYKFAFGDCISFSTDDGIHVKIFTDFDAKSAGLKYDLLGVTRTNYIDIFGPHCRIFVNEDIVGNALANPKSSSPKAYVNHQIISEYLISSKEDDVETLVLDKMLLTYFHEYGHAYENVNGLDKDYPFLYDDLLSDQVREVIADVSPKGPLASIAKLSDDDYILARRLFLINLSRLFIKSDTYTNINHQYQIQNISESIFIDHDEDIQFIPEILSKAQNKMYSEIMSEF